MMRHEAQLFPECLLQRIPNGVCVRVRVSVHELPRKSYVY